MHFGSRLVLREGAASVSQTIKMGEIVGLAGLDGHGQQRFLETLAELEKPSSGGVVLTEINTLPIGLGFQPSAVQAALGVIIVVLVSLYGRERHVSKTI